MAWGPDVPGRGAYRFLCSRKIILPPTSRPFYWVPSIRYIHVNPSYAGKLGTGRLNAYKALLRRSLIRLWFPISCFQRVHRSTRPGQSYLGKNSAGDNVMVAWNSAPSFGTPAGRRRVRARTNAFRRGHGAVQWSCIDICAFRAFGRNVLLL